MYELLTGLPPYGDHGGLLQKNGADIPLINNEEYSQELKEIVYKLSLIHIYIILLKKGPAPAVDRPF